MSPGRAQGAAAGAFRGDPNVELFFDERTPILLYVTPCTFFVCWGGYGYAGGRRGIPAIYKQRVGDSYLILIHKQSFKDSRPNAFATYNYPPGLVNKYSQQRQKRRRKILAFPPHTHVQATPFI